jgi:hypothetical protein
MPESSGVATNDGGESNTHDRQGSSKNNDLTKSSKLYLGSTTVLIRSDPQKSHKGRLTSQNLFDLPKVSCDFNVDEREGHPQGASRSVAAGAM